MHDRALVDFALNNRLLVLAVACCCSSGASFRFATFRWKRIPTSPTTTSR